MILFESKEYARPHPSPLPQERENHPPVIAETMVTGNRALLEANIIKLATAIATVNQPEDTTSFTLSPGERAGVRADVHRTS